MWTLIQEQMTTQMAMQERLDAELAERDAMAKQAEALKQAADNESRAAMEKLQQAQQEAAAAAMSAKQELADIVQQYDLVKGVGVGHRSVKPFTLSPEPIPSHCARAQTCIFKVASLSTSAPCFSWS